MFHAKKLLAILLATLLVFAAMPLSALAGTAENAAVIYVNDGATASAKRGDEITVTVDVTAAAATSIALQMGKSYDADAFEFVSGEWLLADGVLSDVDFDLQNAVIAFENATDIDGAVFEYVLKVKVDAAYSTYSIAAPVVIEQEGATATVTAEAATVTVAADPSTLFSVAEDFENIAVTGTEGGFKQLPNQPFGNALWFGRGANSANATITFDKVGNSTDAALAFWFDTNGSGYNGAAGMSFVPLTPEGTEMCMGTGYTYYTVIDGVVAEAHPSGNFTISLPANSTGWVIMPLPGAAGTVWHKDGPGTAYTGTCQNMAGVYLEYIYYTDASCIVDQFSFVKDVDGFKALVADNQENIPGYVGIPSLDVREDFENATNDTYAGATIVSCGSPFGKAASFSKDATVFGNGSGTIAGYDVIKLNGNASAQAIAFYYNATAATSDVKVRFTPINANNAGECIAGGSPVVTVIDGVLNENNTTLISENFTMKFPAGTSGWVVLDISKTSHWDMIGAGPNTAADTVAIGVCVTGDNTAVILDQFGYVNDVADFTADAVAGDDELPGYTGIHDWQAADCANPKTCKDCGATEGEPAGTHSYVGGICTGCNSPVYDVAEDFKNGSVSLMTPGGSYELVKDVSPYGQALKFARTDAEAAITVALDEAGTADHEAIVFYYDNTVSGYNGDTHLNIIPRTSTGRGITLGTAYTYYTVIDGVVASVNPDSNMRLLLPQNSKGWVILPLPADGTWDNGGSGTYYGSTQDIKNIYLYWQYYNNAAIVVDQFGFTKDVDTFKAEAVKGLDHLNGYGDAGCEHEYTYACDKVCALCGEVTNEAADHSVIAVGAVDATCYENGNMAYWYCEYCGTAWADEALTQQTNLKNVVTPMGHGEIIHVDAKTPNCYEAGNIEYWYCEECGQAWLDEACTLNTNLKAVVLPVDHSDLVHFEAVEAACHYAGNIEYWVCYDCETWYADAALTQITNAKNVIVPALGGEVVHVEAVEPTCSQEGNIECWYCETCEQVWQDEALTQLTNFKNVMLGYGDHSYVDFVCEYCGDIAAYAASIGDAKFATLAEAFAALKDGDVLVLQSDIVADETYVIAKGMAVTLDLNGKTVSMVAGGQITAHNSLIENYGKLTIVDTVGGGKLSYLFNGTADKAWSYVVAAIRNFDTLTINGGTVESLSTVTNVYKFTIDSYSTSADVTVNVNGGAITAAKGGSIRGFANSSTYTNTINVTGGEITGQVWMQDPSKNANKGVMNITGGIINANAAGVDAIFMDGYGDASGMSANIGGTVVVNGSVYLYSEDATKLFSASITGGTFNGDVYVCAWNADYTEYECIPAITGGTFASDVSEYCADGFDCTPNADGTFGVALHGHTIEHVAAVAPTCYENGNVEYWYCTDCGYAWLDEACTLNTNLKAVVLPAAHGNIIAVDAKDATCYENGNIAYWYCETCGQAWLDEACTLNTNLKAVVLPMIDCDGEATCTEAGVCSMCGNVSAYATGHTIADGVCTGCGLSAEWVTNEDGTYFYLDGQLVKGLIKIDGECYYFATGTYRMQTNKTIWVKANNPYGLKAAHYKLGADGKLAEIRNGFITNEKGTFYYVDDVVVKGLYEIDGELYYFFSTGDGHMITDRVIWVKADNAYGLAAGNYYLGTDGKMVKDGFGYDANGKVVYYSNYQIVKGLYEVDGNFYYFATGTGAMATSKTVWIGANNAYGLAAGNYTIGANGIIALF